MLKLLKNLKGKDWLFALCCLGLVSAQVWLDLTLPDFMSDITKLIVSEGSAMSEIWLAGGKMLLCALGSAFLSVVVGYFAARIASDFSYAVRGHVFGQVSDFGTAEIKRFSTASLITRTTNDITQIQMVVAMGLQVMIKAPIMAVWAVLKIIGKSWELSLITACAVVAIMICISVMIAFVMPKFKIIQRQIDDVNRVTRENLTGLRVIRAFNAEDYQEAKFEVANQNLMSTQLFTSRAMSIMMPFMSLIMSGLSLGTYWLGAHLVENIAVTGPQAIMERINTFSNVVVFSSYAMYVVMAFMMMIMIFMILPRAQVSAKRINEVLDTDIAVKEGKESPNTSETGTVEFRNVSFRYPDAADNCLEDISFKVNKGETIAFIGATGSGKSTLVGMAARLYDATEGEVLVDGINVKDYTFKNLYDRMGYVPQKAVLFAGTVADNVSFGQAAQQITGDDVAQAIEIAQGSGFVLDMPKGYDSEISQGGSNVSGGQKQRLAIARAIARRPEILIFDDSFSALDYRTDAELRHRLTHDLKGTTCMIVAQRIGTIKNADKIVVLEDGKIAGQGTHDELMNNCPIYKEIALSQLSAAELG